jgi:hypothetical protein
MFFRRSKSALRDGDDYRWKGLSRYLSEEEQMPFRHLNYEYAKVVDVIETKLLKVTYYADAIGESTEPFSESDLHPQWGIDVLFDDTIIRYGPWADRQR